MTIETGVKSTVVVGVKGLKKLGGRIQEDYLATFKSWEKAIKTFREMQDDGIIATLLDAIKLPLLAAEFVTVLAGDTEDDENARQFLWDNLHGMISQSWRNHVATALEILDYGWAIAEIVMEKRDDGRLWLKNLEPRGQETLYQWKFTDDDSVLAFIQRDPDTGKTIEIPISKCLHFTSGGRKGNPQGKSLLQTLWRSWRYLRNLEELEAIGIERDVGGMPMAELPEGVISTADRTAIETALKNLRNDEESYLIIPNGMKLSAYGGGNKIYNVAEVIERKKKEILMRRFAQFLMLGMEKVGTQALVKGSQDFFTLGLIAIQQELLEVWNEQLIPYLFKYNKFPGLMALPSLTWADPGKVDISALLNSYQIGVGAGVLTVIREDEESLRTFMGLPDLPEGEGEGPRIPIEQKPLAALFGK